MEPEGTARTRPLAQSFIIKRPRLTKLLDESGARIILLVAPAGYGKTTLAREWLKEWRGPVAWFSSSTASADVAALALGLAEELDAVGGDDTRSSTTRVGAVTAVQQRPDALARVLVRSRTDWQPKLVLAIDDYHHLSSNPAAEDFIGALVQLLPVTFVITSRSRPSWLASRFSIYGEAFELGTAELAMTDDEAEAVLSHSRRVHTEKSIGLARGWPAIIGLAAHTETEKLPDVIPARLYEFLAEDLVGTAPAGAQKALAALALTGVGELPVAQDLLGDAAVADIHEAERRGLLTFNGSHHFTLHPLLAEFLIARLRRETHHLSVLVDELVPVLLAGRRWNECLAVAEAVPERLFPLETVLQSALEQLLSEGRVATVDRWVQLARRSRLDSPIVDLAESEIALLGGEYEKALAFGSRAARALVEPEFRTRAQLVAARAAHITDDRATAKKWFRRAEASAVSNRMRAAAIWGHFLVTYEDELENIHDALSRYVATSDGSVEHQLRCTQGRLLVAVSEGAAADALDASATGVALLPLPAEPMTRLATLNQHAWILGWTGRYGESLKASDRAQVEAETIGFDFALMHIQLTRATALIGLRRFSSAQQILTALSRRLKDEPNKWALSNLHIAEAKLQIGVGDLGRANECLAVPPAASLHPAQVAEHDGHRGLISAARGLAAEAEGTARQLTTMTSHAERIAFPALIRAMVAAHEDASAQVSMQFELALSSGLNDVIVTACRACPKLVAQVSKTAHRDRLAALLSESSDYALASSAGIHLARLVRKEEALSPRELEVYELIVQGRTNREISQTLFIAESTTKVHVSHILEKLGVRSRVDAVRAWRLDIDS